jgi:hypothetical protein
LNSPQPLTAEQRLRIEQAVIDDYILVYEAIAQDLENDPRINDILVQKMRHVLSGTVTEPDAAELENYYQQNPERYRLPARVTTEELVFTSRDALPEALTLQLAAGVDSNALNTPLLYTRSTLPRVTAQDLGSIFSEEFALQVFAAAEGQWSGPFLSNRGQHWLKITERFAEQQLPWQEVAEQLRLDWMTLEEEQRITAEVARLREQYQIIFQNRPEQRYPGRYR